MTRLESVEGSQSLLARSSKIAPGHFSRSAIVYVRQSSARQVKENIESTQLQYDLVRRAKAYGWPREQIEVIDDDLGVSGQTLEGRLGFQRLLAEISLGHVGIVFGIEMSRLARNCRDWHHLLELCAVFDSLLGDVDGIYSPREHNDRLLLGLKGTMSEAERERAPEPWGSNREKVLTRHSEEPTSPSRQPVDGDRVASVWRRLDRGVPLGGRCEPPRDATASRCPDASHGSPYRQRGVCRECL